MGGTNKSRDQVEQNGRRRGNSGQLGEGERWRERVPEVERSGLGKTGKGNYQIIIGGRGGEGSNQLKNKK